MTEAHPPHDPPVVHRLEQLLEATLAIGAQRTLEDVLRRIVESARVVVGARYSALGVLAEDGRSLARFETAGMTAAERGRIGALPTGHGLLGHVIREAKPLRIARIGGHPHSSGFPAHHPPMESFLGVPIAVGGRVFGNLYLTEKIGASEFTVEDERIAILFASQAAAAIENARLNDAQALLVTELQTLQRQRDQFFAMINHELRNALTGVYGWAEQLRRAKSPATAQRASDEIFDAAERTITLVNNLLDLSRLDAGKVQAIYRNVALDGVIRHAWAMVEPTANGKGIALRTEYALTQPTISTDGGKLEQVVLNLLSNAVRHTPKGETITVRAESMGDSVVISVTDRGPGITAEDQPRIFEPFIRVDPESGLGSGLGLPVARRMTELLGGRLAVHSELGKGATFTISLPAGGSS